jgi:F-type H+-transporting ATPase subunit delta
MQLLDKVCSQNHDFVQMLRSPIISGDKKIAIVNAIFKERVHELTYAFIQLLVTKGRELNLPEIASAFIEQYNVVKNITSVKLTTAAAIDNTVKDSIIAKVAAYLPGDSIDLKTEVDPELIGGFLVEVGDKLYDASVKKSLADIRSKIVDTSYVSKM